MARAASILCAPFAFLMLPPDDPFITEQWPWQAGHPWYAAPSWHVRGIHCAAAL